MKLNVLELIKKLHFEKQYNWRSYYNIIEILLPCSAFKFMSSLCASLLVEVEKAAEYLRQSKS